MSCLYETKDNISFVTLNRPEKLNAINMILRRDLLETLRKAENDRNSKVVVLRGAGRAFSAGADLSDGDGGGGVDYWRKRTEEGLAPYLFILGMKKPVVCGVQGYALGLGFGLMQACDIIIATENAKIGTPEIRYGASSTEWILPLSIGRNKAMELFLTGDLISGKEAEQLGIVSKSVPPDKFDRELLKVAKKLALVPSTALIMNKIAINEFYRVHELRRHLERMYDAVAVLYGGDEWKRLSEMQAKMPLKEYLSMIHSPFEKLDSDDLD